MIPALALYGIEKRFALFDVLVGHNWLDRSAVEAIAKLLSVEVVPVVGTGTLSEAIAMTTKGFDSKWGGRSEGLVLRPEIELSRRGRRVITKLKHKDFH